MRTPKLAQAKLYDVMLTRPVLITEPGGEPTSFGPAKGEEPVKISVSRRVGNQIVGATRGYWAHGKPTDRDRREPEPSDPGADTSPGPSSKSKKTTRGPSGV